jgi:hypothetical protein
MPPIAVAGELQLRGDLPGRGDLPAEATEQRPETAGPRNTEGPGPGSRAFTLFVSVRIRTGLNYPAAYASEIQAWVRDTTEQ